MKSEKQKKNTSKTISKEEAILLSAIKWNFEAYATQKNDVSEAGLCMNCNRRLNCVWKDKTTSFCEHYL